MLIAVLLIVMHGHITRAINSKPCRLKYLIVSAVAQDNTMISFLPQGML